MTAHGLNAFDESQIYTSPERRLMLATITNAVADALGSSTVTHSGERAKVRREAIAWFRAGDSDFQTVCHLAGLDPFNTRRAVLRYAASGQPMPAMRRSTRSTRSTRTESLAA